jgi:hypothetical protein
MPEITCNQELEEEIQEMEQQRETEQNAQLAQVLLLISKPINLGNLSASQRSRRGNILKLGFTHVHRRKKIFGRRR